MHLVVVEYQVELADILKSPVERLDKDLDQVQDPKFGFGAIDDKAVISERTQRVEEEGGGEGSHKVQSSIMSINNPHVVLIPLLALLAFAFALALRRGREREYQFGRVEEVAYTRRPVRDEREDLRDEALLHECGEGCVEFGQARFAW